MLISDIGFCEGAWIHVCTCVRENFPAADCMQSCSSIDVYSFSDLEAVHDICTIIHAYNYYAGYIALLITMMHVLHYLSYCFNA